MYKWILLAAFVFIVAGPALNAQKPVYPVCGWKSPASDPLSKSRMIAVNQQLRAWIEKQQLLDDDQLYTLPVVVHVVHTGTPVGSPDNPTDADIQAMIHTLNLDMRKTAVQAGGVDMKIQFQLAARDPNCNTTTGIIRVNGSSLANYTSGGITIGGNPGSADQVLVKNLSRWSNTDYINIWVVNKIDGSATLTGGFAYFAEYNTAAIDGIVINAAYANGNAHTITHEMGHVFELYHTFYDNGFEDTCPRTDSCSFYGDLVCDTESGLLEYSCSNTVNSCTGAAYQVADQQYGYTVLNNFMNYTNCPHMFTAGQKARVRATLFNFRPGLIHSQGLVPAGGAGTLVACSPFVPNALSNYYGIERVEFNTINVYSNSSSADLSNFIDRTCSQRTNVYRNTAYELRVKGSFRNPHAMKAYIDYNNDGDFDDAGETILSAYTDSAFVMVTIPATAVTSVPLRMRIVADNPAPGYPTWPSACQLNGTPEEGSGQVEDYAIIVVPGASIQSVASGAWNNPSTWNCQCIPRAGDVITIKNGHTVSVSQAMGLIEFSSLTIETGGNLQASANATIRQIR